MKKPKLLVSISGGETSALLAYLINKKYGDKYDVIYVFANTSREKEKTLIFLENVRRQWGLNIVWVEAVVHHGSRKSCTHKVTTFSAAKRNGEVFEEVIKKYGIPNKAFPHCTRELKTNPIKSYAKSLDWKNYKIAIGYRFDEPRRIKWHKEQTENHWYLLAHLGITKEDVKAFFETQPFKLGLKEHEGNCKLCHKKSKRKLLTQILEDPQLCDWINKMEILYEEYAPKSRKKDRPPYRFFREKLSIKDLKVEAAQPFNVFDERTYQDLSGFDYNTLEFNPEFDYEEECANACEPF